jgi:hypothetical protein
LALADDYRVEATKDAPPAELAADIASQLAPTGYKVLQGEKRIVCEIWVTKAWPTKADFQPSDSVLYPIEPGSLVGALRFARKGADFRGQEIPAGVYTLRYANQPVDGNHVGTFATRDFLVMSPATADQSPAPVADENLFKTSAQSAESTHPAIIPLIKPSAGDAPAMRQLEENEWWTVRLPGKDAKGGKLALELIVVGKAAE